MRGCFFRHFVLLTAIQWGSFSNRLHAMEGDFTWTSLFSCVSLTLNGYLAVKQCNTNYILKRSHFGDPYIIHNAFQALFSPRIMGTARFRENLGKPLTRAMDEQLWEDPLLLGTKDGCCRYLFGCPLKGLRLKPTKLLKDRLTTDRLMDLDQEKISLFVIRSSSFKSERTRNRGLPSEVHPWDEESSEKEFMELFQNSHHGSMARSRQESHELAGLLRALYLESLLSLPGSDRCYQVENGGRRWLFRLCPEDAPEKAFSYLILELKATYSGRTVGEDLDFRESDAFSYRTALDTSSSSMGTTPRTP